MDLTTYAELAVLLVNGSGRLESLEGLRALLHESGRGALAARATRADLDAMRGLRDELVTIFEHADAGDDEAAVERLNGLLVRHPIHPQISGHDGERWHLHLTEGGRISDQYTVGCVMGLAALVTDLGVDRLGLCRAAPCRRAFLDTSSNRSRRYCSERCSSRANVAAYRARKRSVAV
ncbi:CGNR zinc finger domain-containing protein [Spongiactinospora sp. TRM90649]|uniref:CGNR zinc finger domain-containing protein n=1 Tax=Spongiactinospora sp. TRM90649 TaxID=3031114 RepID=UPI0023F6315C|nr:CGNR zinc finger domain-containing protein [Spongiactinospora sp. TRM90649]MDF5756484.1 CGNR zinc finger domain-containing protein [Spongiactinospora sp. TRM90649]